VRAVATLAAPVGVGLMADAVTPALGFALAAIASAAAAFIAFGLRAPSSPGPARAPLADAIREGARFALRHELLRGIAGSPATVARMIRSQMQEAGTNYFVAQFAFGDLTLSEVLRTVELFAREVMPALRDA